MWIFAGYILLALCVIFFSARLGYYVDLLDQKTTLASAFIGGVMLAAVTSLPELFTSITSVAAVGKPALENQPVRTDPEMPVADFHCDL